MNKVTGGSAPARIWHNFMVNAMKGTPPRAFLLPVGAPLNEQAFPTLPADSDAQPIDSPAIVGNETTNVVAVNPQQPEGVNAPPNSEAAPNTPPQEVKSIDQIVKEVQGQKN